MFDDIDDILERGANVDMEPLADLIDTTLQPAEYTPAGERRALAQVSRRAMRYDSPRRRMQRVGRQQACIEQLGSLPGEGEELVMLLDGRWHGFDLVSAVLQLAAEPIDELHIATLGFNQDQTHQLAELIDSGAVGRVWMVVSEMFRDKNPGEFASLKAMLTERGQKLAATRNHAKLLLFAVGDRRIACHGSLNLRRCNSVEQLAMTSDRDLHAFYAEYIEEAIKHAG